LDCDGIEFRVERLSFLFWQAFRNTDILEGVRYQINTFAVTP
jgi:hypothetical protein